jgi:hypothetical protein
LILTVFEKLRSFLVVKRKASINAINICQIPTHRKTLCETLFAGRIPSGVGIGCKVITFFAYVQENDEKMLKNMSVYNKSTSKREVLLLYV